MKVLGRGGLLARVRQKTRRARELLRDVPVTPAPEDLVPPLPVDSLTAARLLFFDELVSRTRDVPGDIVECGVGTGRSLLLLAHVVHARRIDKMLWGFDSFEGFPDPTIEDASPWEFKKGDWAVPKQRVAELLRKHLDDELFFRSRITLVQGFFKDSLSVYKGQISLLHLDCDLYNSYKVCLETLFDKVSPGGIVVFDEYYREGDVWPGAPKAIDEFFADTSMEFVKDPLYGKFYVVKHAGE